MYLVDSRALTLGEQLGPGPYYPQTPSKPLQEVGFWFFFGRGEALIKARPPG
jgi:hypothetical protein